MEQSRRLMGLMVEKRISALQLCEILSIPKKTLALKITGQLDWKYIEVLSIIQLFGYKEVRDVFPELLTVDLTVKLTN